MPHTVSSQCAGSSRAGQGFPARGITQSGIRSAPRRGSAVAPLKGRGAPSRAMTTTDDRDASRHTPGYMG